MKMRTLSLLILIFVGLGSVYADDIVYGMAGAGDKGVLIKIDPKTANATVIGPLGIVGQSIPSLYTTGASFDSNGVLWGFSTINEGKSAATRAVLYTVDTSTGKATIVKIFDISNRGKGIGVGIEWLNEKLYWTTSGATFLLNIEKGVVEDIGIQIGMFSLSHRGTELIIVVKGQILAIDPKVKIGSVEGLLTASLPGVRILGVVGTPINFQAMTPQERQQKFASLTTEEKQSMAMLNPASVTYGENGNILYMHSIAPSFAVYDFTTKTVRRIGDTGQRAWGIACYVGEFGTVSGELNLNPNNATDHEFSMTLEDGSLVTQDDLGRKGFIGYKGKATRVYIRLPKGNANQNTMFLNGVVFPFQNGGRYEITSPANMTVNLYNKGNGMGQWWISLGGDDVTIRNMKGE